MTHRNFIVRMPENMIPDNAIVPNINEEEKKGWRLVDKILGTSEKVLDIYTYAKTGEKQYPSSLYGTGTNVYMGRIEKEKDWTGLTKPWGTVIVLSVVTVVGVAIYKMTK